MKYILMDYVNEAGWPMLTKAEREHWLGAYIAYMEAMTKAGVLRSSTGLQQASAATTVRVANGKTQVLDGPYRVLQFTFSLYGSGRACFRRCRYRAVRSRRISEGAS